MTRLLASASAFATVVVGAAAAAAVLVVAVVVAGTGCPNTAPFACNTDADCAGADGAAFCVGGSCSSDAPQGGEGEGAAEGEGEGEGEGVAPGEGEGVGEGEGEGGGTTDVQVPSTVPAGAHFNVVTSSSGTCALTVDSINFGGFEGPGSVEIVLQQTGAHGLVLVCGSSFAGQAAVVAWDVLDVAVGPTQINVPNDQNIPAATLTFDVDDGGAGIDVTCSARVASTLPNAPAGAISVEVAPPGAAITPQESSDFSVTCTAAADPSTPITRDAGHVDVKPGQPQLTLTTSTDDVLHVHALAAGADSCSGGDDNNPGVVVDSVVRTIAGSTAFDLTVPATAVAAPPTVTALRVSCSAGILASNQSNATIIAKGDVTTQAAITSTAAANVQVLLGAVDVSAPTTVNLNKLQHVSRGVQIDCANGSISNVDLNGLIDTTSVVVLACPTAGVNVKLGNLQRVDSLDLEQLGSTTLSMQKLATVNGDFVVAAVSGLGSLSAPLLTTVNGDFRVDNAVTLTTLDVAALVTLGGTLKLRQDLALACTDVNAIVCAIEPNPPSTSVDTDCTPDASCVN